MYTTDEHAESYTVLTIMWRRRSAVNIRTTCDSVYWPRWVPSHSFSFTFPSAVRFSICRQVLSHHLWTY